jgi:hypothetical protein
MNPGKRFGRIVAALSTILILTITYTLPASSIETLSFPPTSFSILTPDTGITIGRARYRVEGTRNGAVLHGENGYFDGQTDVEVAHIELAPGGQPRLTEFDHTYFNIDGSILKRSHLDLKSGAGTCIDNSNGQKSEQSEVLTIPDDTWAGASIVLPIRNFLRAGDKGISRPLHAFSCAPTAKIFAISVNIDPGNAVWTTYGAEAIRVEVRPDFGLLNFVIAAFVPKLHAWFDPNDGLAFIGDEAARFYKGPPIMLVKKHGAEQDGTPRAK